jgi:hypothetical protein
MSRPKKTRSRYATRFRRDQTGGLGFSAGGEGPERHEGLQSPMQPPHIHEGRSRIELGNGSGIAATKARPNRVRASP